MCGRFNVIDDPLSKLTSELLGINFSATSNSNVCPSETISTVAMLHNKVAQVNASWGIRPSWSKKLLINAQSETVATKKTFKNAFASNRCVIPFSGWYEWKTLESGFKQKYLFSNDENVLYMAALLFEQEKVEEFDTQSVDLFGNVVPKQPNTSLVSLTTAANEQCASIHHRMPLLLDKTNVMRWVKGSSNQATSLLFTNQLDLTIQKS